MNFIAVQGALSDAAPALAFTAVPSEFLYTLVWKELGGTTIWCSSCDGSLNWTTPMQIEGQDDQGNPWVAETDHGPTVSGSILPEGGIPLIFVAWTGKSGKIWYSTSPDGRNWSPQVALPGVKTDSSPSLMLGQGPVTVAWTNDILISSTALPFGNESELLIANLDAGTEIHGVAVGPSQNPIPSPGLIFVWRKASDDSLWYVNTDGSAQFQLKGPGFVALSSHVPSFNSSGAGLAWKGRSEHVWCDKYFPASEWGDTSGLNQLNEIQQEIPGASTNHAPAWAGITSPPNWDSSGPLVFVAYNMTMDGFSIVNGQLISCIPE